ncbi:hypothetical protein A2U01_0098380, partial [Trifolium medium]|nr:hypothetical protein [Trifolium medium]
AGELCDTEASADGDSEVGVTEDGGMIVMGVGYKTGPCPRPLAMGVGELSEVGSG